ncbi:MAG TPA: MlaD family protein [Verrucomicrobiae bacterium]|jgi:phospholipid/cholesterol/gamma-HCH transport system substrate-binding protein
MKESTEGRLGLFFALAVVLALVILETVGSIGFLHRGLHVRALFKNVQDLRVGDPVKMAGVRVGRVERVTLSNPYVEVQMSITSGIDVKTDSKANISFTGLMAQNYVGLDFGTVGAPAAADGATLQTSEQPDLGQMFAKLDAVATGVENLTRTFSGEKLDTFLGPLTDFIKDNRTNITASVSNMKTISDRIIQGQGTVGKLINDDTLYASAQGVMSNLQTLPDEVKGVSADAHTLITNANQTITDAREGRGTLGKLMTEEVLYDEAKQTMTNLESITRKIDKGQGSVGQLINDDTFLKGAKLSLQKIDKATESLEDTGPLSILGTMVSSLF